MNAIEKATLKQSREDKLQAIDQFFTVRGSGKSSSAVTCVSMSEEVVLLGGNLSVQVLKRDSDPEGEQQYKAVQTYSKLKAPVECVRLRDCGLMYSVGDGDGSIHVCSTVQSKSLRKIKKAHTGPVTDCAYVHNRVNLLSTGMDSFVHFWDIPTGRLLQSGDECHEGGATCSSVGGSVCVTGGNDGVIRTWDFRENNSCKLKIEPKQEGIGSLLVGEPMLSVAVGPSILFYDLRAPDKPMETLKTHTLPITGLASTGGVIFSSGNDGRVKIVSLKTFDIVHSFTYECAVTAVGASSGVVGYATEESKWFIRTVPPTELLSNSFLPPPKRREVQNHEDGSLQQHNDGKNQRIKLVHGAKQRKIEGLVKSFEYKKALEVAVTKPVDVTLGFLLEMGRRGALRAVVRDQSSGVVKALTRLLSNEIDGHPATTKHLLEVVKLLLEENKWVEAEGDEETMGAIRELASVVGSKLEEQKYLRQLARQSSSAHIYTI